MLEAYFYELGWMLFALFFGVFMGSLTGIIPGFHVNNVALILLALSPSLLALGIPLSAVAGIIVSTGTVHTFLNYIPSALMGAPVPTKHCRCSQATGCSSLEMQLVVLHGRQGAPNLVSFFPYHSSLWHALRSALNLDGTINSEQCFPSSCSSFLRFY